MSAIHKWKIIISGLSLVVLLVASTEFCFAQPTYLPLNRDFSALFDTQTKLTNSGFYSSIRPFMRTQVEEVISLDSILESATPDFMDFVLREEKKQGVNTLELYPLPDLKYGREFVLGDRYNVTGLGISGLATFGEKLAVAATYSTTNGGFVNYVDSFVQATEVVPGLGYAHPTQEGYAYTNFAGYVSYSPSDYFNFQLGQGKNFFGNGYRSLLLSDVANNYPFLKISTTIWKIKYVNLFTMMNSVEGSGGKHNNYQRKYASFHYLSWNATKWLNISLFESIVWAGEDSSGVRGYDINYLNPVIFYRPVEFSLGSSDNAILGTNVAAKLSKSVLLYGQVVLDEFFLVHIRMRDGWWANKQGFQLGVRAWNLLNVKGLSCLLEYNRVRPFTYSHGLKLQNYSNFGQPLAHPLGANFYETTAFLRYAKGPYSVEGSFVYAVKGIDPAGSNYGGDIFLDANTPRTKEYGNYIGQGIATTVIIGGIKAAYLIYPAANLKLEMGLSIRSHSSSVDSENSTLFTIGVTSTLNNIYHDF